jgi:hypothetical protein
MPSTSNPNFDKEQPEGSRETVNEALGQEAAGHRQGVTNKPLEEEERQQEKLPPRGEAKEEDGRRPHA